MSKTPEHLGERGKAPMNHPGRLGCLEAAGPWLGIPSFIRVEDPGQREE